MPATQGSASAAGAVSLVQNAFTSGAATLSGLPRYVTAKTRPRPPSPPKAPKLTPQEVNLQHTARILWTLSFALLWLSLTSHGWQRAKYEGTREVDGQKYHRAYIANYGLRNIAFDLTTSHVVVPYASWTIALEDDQLPYILILLVQFFMAIATVAGTGVCLAHIRAKCARTAEGTNKYMRYSAYAAIPLLTFTGLASVAWKCIPTSAFYVFCTNAGCVKEDAEGMKAVGVYYAWIGNLSSTVLSFFLFLTLWRLSRYQDSDETEEVEIQLVDDQHNKQAIINARNKAFLVDGSGGVKTLKMGAKVSTPLSIRSPAEAWNPQSAQLPYTAVGKVQSGGFGSTQPSWLTGV